MSDNDLTGLQLMGLLLAGILLAYVKLKERLGFSVTGLIMNFARMFHSDNRALATVDSAADGAPVEYKEPYQREMKQPLKPTSAGRDELGRALPQMWLPALVYKSHHIMLVGQTGIGKSTVSEAIKHELLRLKPDAQFVDIDPHGRFADPDPNGGAPIVNPFPPVGSGNNSASDIMKVMEALLKEMRERLNRYSMGFEDFPELWVFTDEWGDIKANCDPVATEMISKISSQARKVKIHLVIMTHSDNVAALGIDSHLRENFTAVYLGAETRRITVGAYRHGEEHRLAMKVNEHVTALNSDNLDKYHKALRAFILAGKLPEYKVWMTANDFKSNQAPVTQEVEEPDDFGFVSLEEALKMPKILPFSPISGETKPETKPKQPQTDFVPRETSETAPEKDETDLKLEMLAKLALSGKLTRETEALEVTFDVKAGGGKKYQELNQRFKDWKARLSGNNLESEAV